jgi:hypothetical protein
VLPKGFVRIRHFGFLANRQRKALLQKCREVLSPPADSMPSAPVPIETDTGREIALCPVCHTGRMVVVDYLPRSAARIRVDSS